MIVKSLVSAFALTAAVSLSVPSFAQDAAASTDASATAGMEMNISEEDLPAVTERCNQLYTAQTNESLTEDSDTNDESADSDAEDTQTNADANAGSADATVETVEPVNEIADATSTIDLDTITLEWCQEAGIGQM